MLIGVNGGLQSESQAIDCVCVCVRVRWIMRRPPLLTWALRVSLRDLHARHGQLPASVTPLYEPPWGLAGSGRWLTRRPRSPTATHPPTPSWPSPRSEVRFKATPMTALYPLIIAMLRCRALRPRSRRSPEQNIFWRHPLVPALFSFCLSPLALSFSLSPLKSYYCCYILNIAVKLLILWRPLCLPEISLLFFFFLSRLLVLLTSLLLAAMQHSNCSLQVLSR